MAAEREEGADWSGCYLTKASSNPGAGDVLMGFLGSVILSFAFSMAKHREFSGRFIKLINVPSYSPNGLISLTFRSQKRCELMQGTEYRKSLKFTMPSRRD